MARNQTFVDGITPIPADWLNFINTVANTGNFATTEAIAAPTTGTHAVNEFVRNSQPTLLGATGSQYIIDGWQCTTAGTPGIWVEIRLSAAPAPNGPVPVEAQQTPPGGTFYTSRVQGESMTGSTALDAAGVAAAHLPSDFDGTGVADQDTTSGVTHTATFTGVANGTYTINFRFFGFGSQQNSYQVDSATAVSTMWTGNGTSYLIKSITGVSLTAGTHTVKFISDWGFTFIDYVELVQTSTNAAAPAPAPAPAPAASAIAFGSRLDGAYPHGIAITGTTTAAQDAAVTANYNAWKAARLKTAPTLNPTVGVYAGQTVTGAMYVDFGDGAKATVSEGIGYGMLISVIFGDKTTFDALHKFARSYPAYAVNTQYVNTLMDWMIKVDFTSGGGGYNASDGDMDIALAYLMANRQWGSAGTVNYYNEALNTIAALKALDFASNGVMWDWYHDLSRTSDYMTGHFRSFKKATNDTFWDNAVTNSLSLISSVISSASPSAHLPPDWIYQPFTSPQPSPGGLIESSFEGQYGSNAVRDSMRWGVGYLFSGNTSEHDLASNIVTEIKTVASNDVNQTSWLYDLTGAPTGAHLYYEPTQDACTMVGAMVDVAHQTWLNDCFAKLTASYNTGYYAAELSLISMIIASGNWWIP